MDSKNEKIQRVLKMTFEDGFSKTCHEIVLKSEYSDGIDFKELINSFRQFLIVLGYTESAAKSIISVSENDLELLGIDKEDLTINEYDF